MTTRQFSLAHLTALDSSPPDLIRIAALAGYEFVGLRTMALGLRNEPRYDMSADALLYRETKAALRDTGVRLLDIELARILDDHDPREFLPALEAGAALGARHVLTSIWTEDRRVATDAFGVLCDLARPLDLTVNLEFVAWAGCRRLAGAVDVIRAADRPNAGLMIDTFHFHHAGDAVDALSALPADWFHYAHVSDDRTLGSDDLEDCKRRGREARLFPGEGYIDIAGILDHLPARTICAIELPHRERLAELGPAAFARRCLETTQDYLEARSTANVRKRRRVIRPA